MVQCFKFYYRLILVIYNGLIKYFDIVICYLFLYLFFQCFMMFNLLMDCVIIKVDMLSFFCVVF